MSTEGGTKAVVAALAANLAIAATKFGAWLLTAVALGIAAFGVYCIAWARWPDPTN